jgi:glycosyltransferase involved in cell wall biosynthesis
MQLADEKIIAWQRNPKVSIVIPVYNGADYLREAIDSALAQTYPDIEVIVVNDGSDDGGMTERIAHSYGARINYCYKENGGVASALNAGIQMMSGNLFSWLSHDDVYNPEKVAAQVAELLKLPKPSVLYGDYEVIDDRSRILRRVEIRHYAPDEFRQALICDNPIHGCTALVPRICFERVGLFDERLRTTQDYELWFRMAGEYEFLHMPLVLLKSREHAGQGTVTMSALHIRECNEYLVSGMKKLVIEQEARGENKEYSDMFVANCAVSFRRRGFSQAARHAFREFKHSAGCWKMFMHTHYRSLLLRYLDTGVKSLCQRISLKLFHSMRYSA